MPEALFDDEAVQLMLEELHQDLADLRNQKDADPLKIMRLQVSIWFFEDGIKCQIPVDWQNGYLRIYKEVMKKRNPDYQAYMKLKRKFSD